MKQNPPEMPDWFWDTIERFIETPEFKEDTVYNVYECGNCVLEHFEDQNRTDRKQKAPSTRKPVITCPCEAKSRFYCKYKICSICHSEFFGRRVLPGHCGSCLKSTHNTGSKEKEIVIASQGRTVKMKESEVPEPYTEPECIHRSECLKIVFSDPKPSILYCKDCPRKEFK